MHRYAAQRRIYTTVLPVVLLAAQAQAALWLDPNWALIGELQTAGIYDTNLTARADGISDAYLSVSPKLSLSRRGSATRLELEAQVERTWFLDYTEFDSTDPGASLLYEYPVRTTGDDPSTRVDLRWGRNSSTNTDLGRRVRSEVWRGRWDQRLFDTGRTVGDVRVDARSTDYSEEDLNTNEALALEARIGYGITSNARLGIGYGHEWTRSAGPVARGVTEGEEDRVTVRLNGQLLPKLSGSIEAGVAFVYYTGAVDREDTAWIAATNLRWEPAAGTASTLRLFRYTDFSPEGGTALRSEAMLEFSRDIGRGFILRAGGGVYRVETFFEPSINKADAVFLTASVGYQFTDRFSAELSERWTNQDDDRDAFDYDRHVITGRLTILF